MSSQQLNAFLRHAWTDADLQGRLRQSSPAAAAQLAQEVGFTVTVGDLTRYKARATTWQLSDPELAVVATWQPCDQPYWWQHVWPHEGVALDVAWETPTAHERRTDCEESEHD